MFKTAYNPTDSPVVVDALGHVIGGGGWGTIETTEDLAKAAVDDGLLVVIDAPGKNADVDAEAREAFDRTATIAERAKRFDALDKDELQTLAVEGDLVDETAEPYKAELVARLTHSDVEPPEKQTGRKASTDKSEES